MMRRVNYGLLIFNGVIGTSLLGDFSRRVNVCLCSRYHRRVSTCCLVDLLSR